MARDQVCHEVETPPSPPATAVYGWAGEMEGLPVAMALMACRTDSTDRKCHGLEVCQTLEPTG